MSRSFATLYDEHPYFQSLEWPRMGIEPGGVIKTTWQTTRPLQHTIQPWQKPIDTLILYFNFSRMHFQRRAYERQKKFWGFWIFIFEKWKLIWNVRIIRSVSKYEGGLGNPLLDTDLMFMFWVDKDVWWIGKVCCKRSESVIEGKWRKGGRKGRGNSYVHESFVW